MGAPSMHVLPDCSMSGAQLGMDRAGGEPSQGEPGDKTEPAVVA